MLFLILAALPALYLAFVAYKLGLFERIALALRPVSLDTIMDRAARSYGNRVLFTTDRAPAWRIASLEAKYPHPLQWSALRLLETADLVGTVLRRHVLRGARIAILKQNHLDIHVFIQAAVRADYIACPINGKFAAHHVAPYLDHLGAALLVSDVATLLRISREGGSFGCVKKILLAEHREAVPGTAQKELLALFAEACTSVELLWLEEEAAGVSSVLAPVPRSAEALLYLVHSSGTTGFPKAVMLKNSAQSYAVRGWLCYVQVSRRFDKAFLAVPNNHQAVILTFNACLLMGLRVHWHSHYDQHSFDAHAVLRQLAEERYTGFFGFPVVYTQLKEIDPFRYNLSRMRFWASTADASHEVVQRHFVGCGAAFRSVGLPWEGSVYMDAQGSSEVGTPSVVRYITRFTRRFDRRIGKPGSTPLGPQIRIRTEDGTPARRGEPGRLEVKGATLFAGYWRDTTRTAQAFTDGWFFTGDVALRHRDGHLVQLDRLVDVIATNRGPVYSLPIEEKIHHHPAVFDACVYGHRQPDGSQLPAIAVALRPGFSYTGEKLLGELNKMLAPQQQLQSCILMPWSEFPIGVTGKTLKRAFRERSEALAAGAQTGIAKAV
ncbi:MAG TPA: class I adenylate-forming enzyme family protein [Candidatus Sulfotelmatobacter sp.]|nr:class I adenylate-forming enzyme family protein [Candidatus Sulfotelmatobacter sp.]